MCLGLGGVLSQDESFQFLRVLGQRFDCISHEPVYLSRMLTLRESEFPRHADYVRSFELASSSRRLIPVTSRLVTSSTLDLLKGCRMTLFVGSTSLKSVRTGVLGYHLASIRWWKPLQKPTWRPATNSKRYRTHQER